MTLRTAHLARNIALSIWIGGGTFLMAVAAPAAFRHAQDRTAAADIVGAMLSRWHYIAILVPLALLIAALRQRRGGAVTFLLSLALLLASAQIGADLKIRAIRQASSVPISSLDRDDPARRTFGILHGVSSLLMLAQVLAGVGVLAVGAQKREE